MRYSDRNYAMCLDLKDILDYIMGEMKEVISDIRRFSPERDFDVSIQLERLEPNIMRLGDAIGLLEYMKGRD